CLEIHDVRFQGCVRQRILSDGHSLAREEQSSHYEKSQQRSATASVGLGCRASGHLRPSLPSIASDQPPLRAALSARTSARVFCSKTSRLIFSIVSQAR